MILTQVIRKYNFALSDLKNTLSNIVQGNHSTYSMPLFKSFYSELYIHQNENL